jgi:isopentenyl diphosphate isomerase/L-lactate dehydrogenase-like FMN-dependent dehydrogenase
MVVMQEEIDTCMRLLGVTRIDQLGPEYVYCNFLNVLIVVEHECS